MSTFDKNAVEESIRLKERWGGDVTIITVGKTEARKTIKEALAMGGDRGCLVVLAGSDPHDTLSVSYFIARATEKFGPFDLLLCAEGSSDMYTGQVGPMLSEWLNLPFIGYVRKLEVDGGLLVRCEQTLEDEIRVTEARLPAIVSVVSEINEPRYPTLIQIMQASKKPVQEVSSEALVDERKPPTSSVTTIEIAASVTSRKRVIFEGSAEETSKKLLMAL